MRERWLGSAGGTLFSPKILWKYKMKSRTVLAVRLNKARKRRRRWGIDRLRASSHQPFSHETKTINSLARARFPDFFEKENRLKRGRS
jgi:hypothetical protein